MLSVMYNFVCYIYMVVPAEANRCWLLLLYVIVCYICKFLKELYVAFFITFDEKKGADAVEMERNVFLIYLEAMEGNESMH